jgi:Ca2+-binding RTX toxin-like protein
MNPYYSSLSANDTADVNAGFDSLNKLDDLLNNTFKLELPTRSDYSSSGEGAAQGNLGKLVAQPLDSEGAGHEQAALPAPGPTSAEAGAHSLEASAAPAGIQSLASGNKAISGYQASETSFKTLDVAVHDASSTVDRSAVSANGGQATSASNAAAEMSAEAVQSGPGAAARPGGTMHYASGGLAEEVAAAGFNLVDIQSVEQLNELPDGMMGLVWLNHSDGVTSSFIDEVSQYIGSPNLFGFFLCDEPDPTGNWGDQVDAADLRAESDWIHENVPGASTFITMMNMGTSEEPDFTNTYNWENTHIDYFGLDPYPVRSTGPADFDLIDRTVAAALDAGIPLSQIVPVYQTFGGGGWTTDDGGRYVMPTANQMRTMLEHWDRLVPNPVFDYAYSWGSQNGDTALEDSQVLQDVFLEHNLEESGGDTLDGDDFANSISGTPADDVIRGFGGDDTLTGRGGRDEIFGGTGDDHMDGTAGADTLHGEAGSDMLIGGGGADSMFGGAGNDTYAVDSSGDVVDESVAGSNGFDRVNSAVSINLSNASHFRGAIEMGVLTGSANLNITGNGLNNLLYGNSGNNVVNGAGGNDNMRGMAGNDTYFVNSAGDVVDESIAGSNGFDRVNSSVSINMSDGVHFRGAIEMGVLTGSANLNITGNGLNNLLYGNSGNNVVNGAGGNDNMRGMAGNDTYFVNSAGDVVDESIAGSNGFDRVNSSVSINMSDGVHFRGAIEMGVLTGSANLNIAGNGLNNLLYGNAGNNVVNGLGGNDVMRGMAGNDTYVVNSIGDVVDESMAGSGGFDRVNSTVSLNLSDATHFMGAIEMGVLAGTANLILVGNSLNNLLVGNDGNNAINGGAGNDVLRGMGGSDTFFFSTALNAASNVDTIEDFSVRADTIRLENSIFTGLSAGVLAANAFHIGAAAADAFDRIVYNSTTGALSFDVDGTGGTAAIRFATLDAGLALTNADFAVV